MSVRHFDSHDLKATRGSLGFEGARIPSAISFPAPGGRSRRDSACGSAYRRRADGALEHRLASRPPRSESHGEVPEVAAMIVSVLVMVGTVVQSSQPNARFWACLDRGEQDACVWVARNDPENAPRAIDLITRQADLVALANDRRSRSERRPSSATRPRESDCAQLVWSATARCWSVSQTVILTRRFGRRRGDGSRIWEDDSYGREISSRDRRRAPVGLSALSRQYTDPLLSP